MSGALFRLPVLICRGHLARTLVPASLASGVDLWRSTSHPDSWCWQSFSTFPPHKVLTMPALLPTMVGVGSDLDQWNVKVGDEVAPGASLADIGTYTTTLDWEIQEDGFIAQLLVPAGSKDLPIDTPLAILVKDKVLVPQFANYATSSKASAAEPTTPAPAPEVPRSSRIGPAAKKLLAENGLSASDVTPTGPKGIVTKYDVIAAIEKGIKPKPASPTSTPTQAPTAPAPKQPPSTPKAAPATPKAAPAAKPAAPAGPSYTDVELTQMRRVIARRLLESKLTTPSLYASADAELGGVAEWRKKLADAGHKVSVNDFVIRAVALALREVPAARVLWDPASEGAKPAPSIDVAVAVATDKGLITPIVKNADTKSLVKIGEEVKDLAARARKGTLKPEEFMGGTFTISNLGMFGITQFSAIINPPQSGILAIGGSQQRVVLKDGKPTSSNVMTVTLSADNRIVDGDVAGAFLTEFSKFMREPLRMDCGGDLLDLL